jgi:hypothetical protein
LLQSLDLLFNLLKVCFRSFVVRVELERLFIMGQGVLQISQRLFVRLGPVSALFQGAADIIMTFLLERFVLGKQRLAEPFQRLAKIPHLVGGCAGIELNLVSRVRVWVFL